MGNPENGCMKMENNYYTSKMKDDQGATSERTN